MLISSLIGATAFLGVHADPLNAPRNAFGRCLQTFVDKAVSGRTSESAFARDYPKQCQAEEKALRDAIRVKETTMKTPAGQIEEFVNMEIEDLRANWRSRFDNGR